MSKIAEKALELNELLKAQMAEAELEELSRPFTLADAIREGALVSEHNPSGWGDGENACALTAAVISARAHNFV